MYKVYRVTETQRSLCYRVVPNSNETMWLFPGMGSDTSVGFLWWMLLTRLKFSNVSCIIHQSNHSKVAQFSLERKKKKKEQRRKEIAQTWKGFTLSFSWADGYTMQSFQQYVNLIQKEIVRRVFFAFIIRDIGGMAPGAAGAQTILKSKLQARAIEVEASGGSAEANRFISARIPSLLLRYDDIADAPP